MSQLFNTLQETYSLLGVQDPRPEQEHLLDDRVKRLMGTPDGRVALGTGLFRQMNGHWPTNPGISPIYALDVPAGYRSLMSAFQEELEGRGNGRFESELRGAYSDDQRMFYGMLRA